MGSLRDIHRESGTQEKVSTFKRREPQLSKQTIAEVEDYVREAIRNSVHDWLTEFGDAYARDLRATQATVPIGRLHVPCSWGFALEVMQEMADAGTVAVGDSATIDIRHSILRLTTPPSELPDLQHKIVAVLSRPALQAQPRLSDMEIKREIDWRTWIAPPVAEIRKALAELEKLGRVRKVTKDEASWLKKKESLWIKV